LSSSRPSPLGHHKLVVNVVVLLKVIELVVVAEAVLPVLAVLCVRLLVMLPVLEVVVGLLVVLDSLVGVTTVLPLVLVVLELPVLCATHVVRTKLELRAPLALLISVATPVKPELIEVMLNVGLRVLVRKLVGAWPALLVLLHWVCVVLVAPPLVVELSVVLMLVVLVSVPLT